MRKDDGIGSPAYWAEQVTFDVYDCSSLETRQEFRDALEVVFRALVDLYATAHCPGCECPSE